MRTRALLATATFIAAACSGDDFPTLDDALERQPAGLVEASVLDDGFVIDPYDWGCNGIRRAAISRVDGRAGKERWEQPVPAGQDVVVFGEHVVTVGTDQDDVPPSALALGAEDGQPVWQRFFAAPSAALVGSADGNALVHLRGEDPAFEDGRVVALDPASGAVAWETAVSGAAHPLGMAGDHLVVAADEQWWQAIGPDGSVGPRVDETARAVLAGDLVLVASSGALVARDVPTGAHRWAVADVFDATYTQLGHLAGVSASALVVELDSQVGPDHRLLVIDPASGAVRWRDDGVATSALVGDEVLLDVRTGSDPDDPIPRAVVARRVTDGAELWRHADASMSGYLVRVGDRALLSGGTPTRPEAHEDFAIADLRSGDGLPDVLGYSARADGTTPTVVGATSSSPAFVAVAARGSSSPSTVAAFDGERVRWEVHGARPAAALAAAVGDVIVLRSDPSVGCD